MSVPDVCVCVTVCLCGPMWALVVSRWIRMNTVSDAQYIIGLTAMVVLEGSLPKQNPLRKNLGTTIGRGCAVTLR